jgi:pentatricopeptide repeat protein
MTLPRPLSIKVLAPLLAFAAMLTVLTQLNHSSSPSTAAPPRDGGGFAAAARSTDERIAVLEAALRADPKSVDASVNLADALLQKVRESGDAALYVRAEQVLDRALRQRPGDGGALVGMASLALARHDFRQGLALARRAHAAAPGVVRTYGVLVDALVELGRYGAAERTLQRMIDLKPNLASYSRVSYVRELHGDLRGAIEAMGLAVSASGDTPENLAYVQTLLGNLEFARGDLPAAERAYRRALAGYRDHVPAQAGLARVASARGHLGAAIRRLRSVVARLPLPEYVVALGETELAAGRRTAAARDFDLVRVEERLLRANGVNTDTELALFEANHGDANRALELARRSWQAAPSVRSADALGWALTRARNPRAGLAWGRRALRLGSKDPLFLFHAGISAARAGNRALARRCLAGSLALNPRFSPLYAPRARRALARLGDA